MRKILTFVLAAALTAPAAVAAPLKSETGSAAGLNTIVVQTMSKFAKRDFNINIQVNSGQTLSKTALALALGKLDLTAVPPGAFALMQQGKSPYARVDNAAEASANLRGLFGFAHGYMHAVVWADSGINTFADIKGRKVFTGPPAGAANRESAAVIRIGAGYEPGEDYEAVKLGWGAGLLAMQDGLFDVFMRPAAVGSASIEQLGAQREFRLLSLSDEVLASEAWQKYTAHPWNLHGAIPAGTYAGQQNNDEDVIVGVNAMQVAVHQSMDDETAYRLTKSFFDNVDEAKSAVATLQQLDETDPFLGMNIPLHPGAIRYFRENGFDIPPRLIPQ